MGIDGRSRRCDGRGRRRRLAGLAVAVGFALTNGAVEGQEGPPLEVGALLRAGVRVEPEETGRNDGFDLYDAHVSLGGEIGIVFEYYVRGAFDTDDNTLRLLDARADLPFIPEAGVGFGLFRPAFGLEALEDEGDFTFLRRSQASEAIAPGRQVGAELFGEALEGRLTYGAGISNGNGTTLENDDNRFLYSARVQFNSIGPIEFYEDLVVQVGASIAYSEDDAAELGPGLVASPDESDLLSGESTYSGERLLWSADAYLSYRGITLTGEYLRGDYEPADPEEGFEELDAYGGYVELSYSTWGALQGVVRYDGFSPAEGENRDFLIFGVNVYPGYYAKLGVQYAVDLHDSPPAPTVAGNQFIFLVQVDF